MNHGGREEFLDIRILGRTVSIFNKILSITEKSLSWEFKEPEREYGTIWNLTCLTGPFFEPLLGEVSHL